jgi:hypothetical protein
MTLAGWRLTRVSPARGPVSSTAFACPWFYRRRLTFPGTGAGQPGARCSRQVAAPAVSSLPLATAPPAGGSGSSCAPELPQLPQLREPCRSK